MGARAARPPGRVPSFARPPARPPPGSALTASGRRSANGAGDRPPAVLPRYRPAATSRSHAPSRPPDRRRSDRSSGLRRRLLRRRFSCLPTHVPLWHGPGRCDTDFSHLDCRSVLILIVALHHSLTRHNGAASAARRPHRGGALGSAGLIGWAQPARAVASTPRLLLSPQSSTCAPPKPAVVTIQSVCYASGRHIVWRHRANRWPAWTGSNGRRLELRDSRV